MCNTDTNIRELKIQNQSLKSSNKQLREEVHALKASHNIETKLLSVISHDYREMVNNVLMICDLYQDSDLSEMEFSQLINELQQIAKKNLKSFDHTLFWIKNQWGEDKIATVSVNLKELLEEIIASFEKAVTRKKIQISLQDRSYNAVQAEPVILKFAFSNLVSNAIKYSHDGGQIEIVVLPSNVFGKMQIKVKDNGIGMDEKTLELLFTPRQRTHSGTQGESGAGIALMICNGLLDLLNCEISAQSQIGKGSVFTIELPADI